MRKAAARMRLRLVSAGFEAWCEFARLRAEARAERRMRFLEAKAEAATKAEAEAVRAREEAADEARRAASAVEAAEAREREARNAERRAKRNAQGAGVMRKNVFRRRKTTYAFGFDARVNNTRRSDSFVASRSYDPTP